MIRIALIATLFAASVLGGPHVASAARRIDSSTAAPAPAASPPTSLPGVAKAVPPDSAPALLADARRGAYSLRDAVLAD